MQRQKWIRILLFSMVAMLLINVFNAFFLHQKEYDPVTISYKATADFRTFSWLTITPKYSDSTYRTETERVNVEGVKQIVATIKESNGIQFLGLYWNGSKQSVIRISDVTIASGERTQNVDNLHKLVTYTSENTSLQITKEHINAMTNDDAYGWIMIDVSGFEKLARNKLYKPLHWLISIFMFLVFVSAGAFYNERIERNVKKLRVVGTTIYKLRIYLLYLWMALLPFWIIISHVLLAISLALTILHFILRKEDFELKVLRKFIPFFLLFFSITLINILFHTTEIGQDFADYSYFLLAPFLFLGIKERQFLSIFSVFQGAVFTYCALLIVAIIERYYQLDTSYSFLQFFFETIEQYWHTSYLAGVIIVAVIFHIVFKRKMTPIYIVLCALSFVFLYLSQARLPLIILLFMMIIVSFSGVLKKRKKLWLSVIVVLTLAITSWLATSESFREQIVASFLVNEKQKTDARPELWEAGMQVFEMNPLAGIGRSEIRQELANKLAPASDIKNRRYNAHNQYLEFLIAYGIIIPILLIVVILMPILLRLKSATIFVIYFALAMVVESYFSRQSGVIFFSIWYCFFILYDSKNKEHTAAISH